MLVYGKLLFKKSRNCFWISKRSSPTFCVQFQFRKCSICVLDTLIVVARLLDLADRLVCQVCQSVYYKWNNETINEQWLDRHLSNDSASRNSNNLPDCLRVASCDQSFARRELFLRWQRNHTNQTSWTAQRDSARAGESGLWVRTVSTVDSRNGAQLIRP